MSAFLDENLSRFCPCLGRSSDSIVSERPFPNKVFTCSQKQAAVQNQNAKLNRTEHGHASNFFGSSTPPSELLTGSVTISAPARLHFGLFSIGKTVEHQFGGIGLMIEEPRTVVQVRSADRLSITGPSAKSARASLETWWRNLTRQPDWSVAARPIGGLTFDELPLAFTITQLPPRHSGFGSGTQLALAMAATAMELLNLPSPGAAELAGLAGRGKRSAIGSYGFHRGGFLVDRGKRAGDGLAPLDFQTPFPEQWQVLTLRLQHAGGLSGAMENDAFGELPATSEQERAAMTAIVRQRMIPGLLQADYELFGDAVYEFGHRSGLMFSPIQNGPYNGPEVAALVARVRESGVPATGQSSWGPCVFAIARNDETTAKLCSDLKQAYGDACEIKVTRADNAGALKERTAP